jgi:MoaA/NifB/PqqE/SkfB family radical SAM enzyme
MKAVTVGDQISPRSTNRVEKISVMYLSAHPGCDCRCMMCDIWKGGEEKAEMSLRQLSQYLDAATGLGVDRLMLSGGEPLEYSRFDQLCTRVKRAGLKLIVFTNGIHLPPHATMIAEQCDQVIVSLDGTPPVHDRIRQRSGCSSLLATGIKELLDQRPNLPITARTVVQKPNCDDLPGIVRYARSLGVRGLSFLAADVTSTAFNRPIPWDEPKISQIALSHSDLAKLSRSIEILLGDCSSEFQTGFLRNSPGQIWDIYRYYKALLGLGELPPVRCHAPWQSAVLESDGTLRPCFLHPPYGKIGEKTLVELISSPEARRFRRQLKVTQNEVCRRCVFAESRLPSDILV